MDALYGYRKLSKGHKYNLKKYLIYDGIYEEAPGIRDEDARFIFSICERIIDENINLYESAKYLTKQFIRLYHGESFLDDLTNNDICSAVSSYNVFYFDKAFEKYKKQKGKDNKNGCF